MTVDDGLTPAESAILIALMVVGDEVTNPDLEKLHGVDVRKENREKLNLLGYVTSAKKGRSFTHVLTEKGWARVNGELNFADKRSKTLGGAMAALHNAVRLRIGSFGELFSQGPVVPAQRPEPEPLPVEKDDLAERIRNVYATLTSGSGAWVSLASLRPHFADVPRADLDERSSGSAARRTCTWRRRTTRRRSPRPRSTRRCAVAARTSTCWRSECDDRGGAGRAAGAELRLGPGPGRRLAPVAVPCGRSAPDGRAERGGGDRRRGQEHGGSPIGVALQGPPGSGKTHMLGWVRQHTQQLGGYFFLVSLLDSKGFWDSVLASMLDGLARPIPGNETQLQLLLRRISSKVGAPRLARRAFMGETELSRETLDAFIQGLTAYDSYVGRNSQDTARALALSASDDVAHQDLADGFSRCWTKVRRGACRWGMRRMPKTSEEIVQELSRLLALTGPTVIAVDQIDTLIAQSAGNAVAAEAPGAGDTAPLEQIAGGLMTLRERTRRTLTVVSCIPATWTMIRTRATASVSSRFRLSPILSTIKDNNLGRAIVEKRFAVRFAEVGFRPPYPTWPVSEKAFEDVGDFTRGNC